MVQPGNSPNELPQLFHLISAVRQIRPDRPILMTRLVALLPQEFTSSELRGMLGVLHSLGLIRVSPTSDNSDLEVTAISEVSVDFMISLALCSMEGIPAIHSWDKKHSRTDPPWGIPLLAYMEERRVRAAKQRLAEPEVVRAEVVVAVIIKSMGRRRSRPVSLYLCQHDRDSDHYNFIGGKVKQAESIPDAAERKMHDELGLPFGTFTLDELEMDKVPISKTISHQSGVYTEYSFRFYRARHISVKAQPAFTSRWFTLSELIARRGPAGEKIMAHAEIIQALQNDLSRHQYPNGLEDMELSLPMCTELTGREGLWNSLINRIDNLQLIVVLLSIVSVTLAILAGILKALGIIP
jgi:8-oxo-dGTP pyrophosphatase MutT (NUDIX family)